MTDFVLVQTTYEQRDDALSAARKLVESRLAACVQTIGPIVSTYRWEGNVDVAEEWLCVAKCRAAGVDACRNALLEDHPYDTPELIAVPIVAGSDSYLAWLADSTD